MTMDPQAEKRHILSKMRPPEEVRAKLAPLRGICTYQILEKIRYEMYERVDWDREHPAENIPDWFSALRRTTTEWETGDVRAADRRKLGLEAGHMTSQGWSSMGEELLALDRATRVPRDHPDTQRVFTAVRSLPEWVAAQVEKQFTIPAIQLLPMGSFPCDTKVCDINEFDFLLVCDVPHYYDMNYCRMIHTDDAFVSNHDGFYHEMVGKAKDFIQDLCPLYPNLPFKMKKDYYTEEVRIVGWAQHGPAETLTLGWKCTGGHHHHIDVDMTFAKVNTMKKLKPMCRKLQETAIFKPVYDAIADDAHPVKVAGFSSYIPAPLERHLHAALAEFSPHTLAAFRLLKVLVPRVLPCRITKHPLTASGHGDSACISSHKLKQLVLRHAEKFPSRGDWAAETLHVRLAQMLAEIDVGSIDKNDALINLEITDDVCSGLAPMARNFQQSLERHVLNLALEGHKEHLAELADLISGGYQVTRTEDGQEIISKNHHDLVIRKPFPENISYLLLEQGEVHLIDNHPTKLGIISEMCISTPTLAYRVSSSDMLYTTHPLVRWCQVQVYRKYSRHPGANFSQIPASVFPEVWTLYVGGMLTTEQLESERTYASTVYTMLKLPQLFGLRRGDPRSCLLTLNCLIGVAQARMVDIISVHRVLEMCVAPLWNPLTPLAENLKLRMMPRDRAVVRRWCHQVMVEADAVTGQDDSHLCDPELPDYLVSRHSIVRSVEYVKVLLSRFAPGRFSGRYLLGQCLLYYTIKHVLTEDLFFFECCQPRDMEWAADFLSKLSIRREEPIKPYELLHSFRRIDQPASQKWIVIRVESGGADTYNHLFNFYRCLAAHGAGDIQRTPRSGSGMILNFADAMTEGTYANHFHSDFNRFFSQNRDLIEEYDPGETRNYRLMSELYDGYAPIGYSGFVRLAALAFITKTQVHVYEEARGTEQSGESGETRVKLERLAVGQPQDKEERQASDDIKAGAAECKKAREETEERGEETLDRDEETDRGDGVGSGESGEPYSLKLCVPEQFYKDRHPVSLLWTPEKPDIPGYYSLMIRSDYVMYSDLWYNIGQGQKVTTMFDKFAEGATDADKSVTFEEILQERQLPSWGTLALNNHKNASSHPECSMH